MINDLACRKWRATAEFRSRHLQLSTDAWHTVTERVAEYILEAPLVQIGSCVKAACGVAQQAFAIDGNVEVTDIEMVVMPGVRTCFGCQNDVLTLCRLPIELDYCAGGQVGIHIDRSGKRRGFS